MAAPVQPTPQLRAAPGPAPVTQEQRYWKTFKSPIQLPSQHSSPITHISSPSTAADPSDTFAITSGNRIQLFSTRTRKLIKTISRFGLDDTAHSGEIRRDGRVLCAGGDSGAVQVFDVNSRAILKTWKQHKQPVWATKWSPRDLPVLMTASDDRTVRLWDLSENESTVSFRGHQDYVRSAAWMPGQSQGLLVSGSYDQTVRLWDPRAPQRAAMVFKHAEAVESVLPLPSGVALLAASGPTVAVLDLVAAKPLQVLRSHQKTVTSLALASNGTRALSAALDGTVKVFDTASWSVVAASKYSSPVLSLSVIPASSSSSPDTIDDRHLAVGLQSGILSIRTRLSGAQKATARARDKEMQALLAGTLDAHDRQASTKKRRAALTQGRRARLRGLDYDGLGAALVVEGNERRPSRKLPPWDKALRRLEYGPALDAALEHPDPTAVLTVLTALVHRSALSAAVAGRDEDSLAPLLAWLARHVSDPRHVVLVSRVAMLVLETYADKLGQSRSIDRLVGRLHEAVRRQVDSGQAAASTRGMLEMLLVAG